MKLLRRTLIFTLILAGLFSMTACFIMKQKKFGKTPSGERLERIKKSPNWRNGSFQNLNPTPQLAEDTSMPEIMFRFLFGKVEKKAPVHAFHFEKTDLRNLDPNQDTFIWMGHSSYYMQIDGKKILVDPVLSGYASPFSFTTKAFKGSDLYTAEDIPELDYLIITHDHWDHLDYNTVLKLFPKTKKIITGLGTGEHLELWGYNPKNMIELDWFESSDLGNGFKINAQSGQVLFLNRRTNESISAVTAATTTISKKLVRSTEVSTLQSSKTDSTIKIGATSISCRAKTSKR